MGVGKTLEMHKICLHAISPLNGATVSHQKMSLNLRYAEVQTVFVAMEGFVFLSERQNELLQIHK